MITLAAWTSDEHFISGNFVGGNASGANGTMSLSSPSAALGFIGMDIETGGPTNIIQNNIIRNVTVSYSSAAGSFTNAGLFTFIGGYNGTTTITGNTISNLSYSNTLAAAAGSGIIANGRITAVGTVTPTFTITNNIISNLTYTAGGTGSGQATGMRIETSSSASLTATSTSNPYFIISGNTITNLSSPFTSAGSWVRGISDILTQGTSSVALLYPKINITNNNINTFSSGGTPASYTNPVCVGIFFPGSSSTGGANATDNEIISQNIISGFTATSTADINNVVTGIYNSNGVYTVTRNRIYDLKNKALGSTNNPALIGINVRAAQATSLYANNFVSLGTGENTNLQVFGLLNNFSASAAVNVYFNSFLITGAGNVGNTKTTSALLRGSELLAAITTPMDLKNNLLINTRTGGSANFAIGNIYTTAPTGFTSNYNDLYSSNSATIGLWGASALDFPSWKATTGQDLNSVSKPVTFVNPATGDLHLAAPSNSDPTLRGIVIPGLTTDYDGNQRSPNAPFMGASEGTSPLPISIEYFNGAKQSNANLLNWKSNCTSTSVSFDIQKSADGRSFNSIGNFSATHDRCAQPFNFTDNNPFSGINYYRLKKTEIDGQVSYSIIVAILNKESGFELVGLLPNVVSTGSAILSVTSTKVTIMQLVVSDIQGKIMQKQAVTVLSGSNTINLDFSKLASGSYQLTGYTNEGFSKPYNL